MIISIVAASMPLLILLISFLSPMVSAQFNLYETDRIIHSDQQRQFDCLHYYVREEHFRGSRFTYPINQMIKYCLRPIDGIDTSMSDNVNTHARNFTFDALRRLNITVQQLLSWSASVDLAERYLLYINQPINNATSSMELFYNCTRPWFGSRCQYSFDLGINISFSDIVERTFREKSTYKENRHIFTNLTCYIDLKCNRGAPMCLDWREVCNGRIDCSDGGADEAQCFKMEMNECAEDEYRCHNGLCIPGDFWRDDENNPDCLDRTDEPSSFNTYDSCFKDPTFRCEENTCRPPLGAFPCGDGQCESLFYRCNNHRHKLLEESTLASGNLSDKCWMVMACLTLINTTLYGKSCNSLFDSSSAITSYLSTCDPLFQFPINSVALGHVRFFYHNNRSELNMAQVFQPDYVCYDEQLCNSIVPTFRNESLRCALRHQIPLNSTSEYSSFVKNITSYFRGCSSAYLTDNEIQSQQHSSLYCCDNSSKCISKHRLLDGMRDCQMGDDERYKSSCSLNKKYRFQCDERENKCYSPIMNRDTCKSVRKQNLSRIFFHEICDNVDNLLLHEIDGQNHTDETECDHWPCSNIYTRCDDFWACKDGKDEYGCLGSECPLGLRPCLSPVNNTLTCLSRNHVNDGTIDCLGASDEFELCRAIDSVSRSHYRFRCGNNTKCTASSNFCDQQDECPLLDDEKFCEKRYNICVSSSIGNRSKVDDTLCQLFGWKIEKNIYFALENSSVYPTSQKRTTDQWSVRRLLIATDTKSQPDDPAWAWRCNRGLYARIWPGEEKDGYRCFCPPSYYAESCQYQNQRVSLTLGTFAADRNKPYSMVVRLIDENSQISSYEQFPFMASWGCIRPFNIYLLYSTRPKDIFKNYSVQIDAFDKNNLVYLASWHLPIPFPFLPVNRLVGKLIIPVERVPISHSCNLTCKNGGQCMKYVNAEKFFCRCQTNWSGSRCDQPVNCADCSSDSICVGSVNNRSICVCPSDKVGPRCLITSSCMPDTCKNNGQCVLIDDSVTDHNYVCICSDEFYGVRCENSKKKLEISLNNKETASYILAYIITVSNESQPYTIMMIKKLIHDKYTITFHISEPFHMVFVKINQQYYLVIVKPSLIDNIPTSIIDTPRCSPIDELFNSTLLTMPRIRLVKYYHLACEDQINLQCFFDEFYMCLCTHERHANCFEFNHKPTLTCRHNDYCQNGASCFQNDPICPSVTLCICTDCYFGNQCQFFAKGFGLTLDDILRYEIRRNLLFSQQRMSVKVSAVVTGLMFVLGLVNGILSCLTFRRKNAQQVGCGVYLFASSITSLLTLTMLTLKFWFLYRSQIDLSSNRTILHYGCVSIEPFLKALLYMDNWFKGCVAIERSITVFKGVNFHKATSKRIARWVIIAIPVLIITTIIHEPIHRDLFDNEEDNHNWCVTRYSRLLQDYNSTITVVHFIIPFVINLSSALFIIINVARQRSASQNQQNYRKHLHKQFDEHKHMLISPSILVILSLPRLIISLMSSCVKASRDPWLYLLAYFISFTPSVLIFVVFVLPSDLYSKEFKASFKHWQR